MSYEPIIPYLWNPKTDLRPQAIQKWKRMDIYHHSTKDGEAFHYLNSRINNSKKGKLKTITSFETNGEIESVIEMVYPDPFTEISQLMVDGQKQSSETKRFNEQGFLVEHVEHFPRGGGSDVTQYVYDEQNRIVEISRVEEDGENSTETFTYSANKLFKIVTKEESGGTLVRGFNYNEKGLLEKMIRMQNDLVNLEITYKYNDKNQLLGEFHESTNRIHGGKNKLFITEYTYHNNGQLASETFKILDTYEARTKSESIEYFDFNGLQTKNEEIDFVKDLKEWYEYKYKMLEQ